MHGKEASEETSGQQGAQHVTVALQRGVSGSLYAPGTFPRSTPAAPPIYRVHGGNRRPQEAITIDIRLRDAKDPMALVQVLEMSLGQFDTGNVVIALACAAKLDVGNEMGGFVHSAAWTTLQERLVDCVETLEPRGMSMSAYAAARLMWGEHRLLDGLARVGTRRALDFGSIDVAKGCWAFAKLRFVAEETAVNFWRAMAEQAPRVVNSGRFVDTSMMAWAFAMTGCGTATIYQRISQTTLAVSEQLPPRSLAGISWALSRARHQDHHFFTVISRRARSVVQEFSAHDAAALCWALSAAETTDGDLFSELAEYLVGSGSLARLSAPLAAELAWAFAAARVEHVPFLEVLERMLVAQIWDLETEDVASFGWSFAVFRRFDPSVFTAIASYADRFTYRLRRGELQMLTWAISLANLDLPGLDVVSRRLQETQAAHVRQQ